MAEHTQFRFEDLSRSASIASGVNEEIGEEGPETAFNDIGCNSLGFLEIEPAMEQHDGFIADAAWIRPSHPATNASVRSAARLFRRARRRGNTPRPST